MLRSEQGKNESSGNERIKGMGLRKEGCYVTVEESPGVWSGGSHDDGHGTHCDGR